MESHQSIRSSKHRIEGELSLLLKVKELFHEYFSDELTNWLLDEIKTNKKGPLCDHDSQQRFWERPAKKGSHDPRGCPSYVAEYVDNYLEKKETSNQRVHRPFPTIIDSLSGKCCKVQSNSSRDEASLSDVSGTSSDCELDSDKADDIEIPDEFKIDNSAVKQISVS